MTEAYSGVTGLQGGYDYLKYYLVLGATNSVIDHAAVYPEVSVAAKAVKLFINIDAVEVSAGAVISADRHGVNYRALYIPLEIDESKLDQNIYVLVRSVPYLHSSTSARVFYDENEAQAEADSFNAAVSRSSFHAYMFIFPVSPKNPWI